MRNNNKIEMHAHERDFTGQNGDDYVHGYLTYRLRKAQMYAQSANQQGRLSTLAKKEIEMTTVTHLKSR